MTGRLGLRTGVFDLFWPESYYGLPRNESTIAELLLEANYSTAILGKSALQAPAQLG
jgi:arylsulfatase A-like enzyme